MGRILAMVAAIMLSACAGGRPAEEVAYYDLSAAEAGVATLPFLRTVEVAAPSWLDSGALQYRLNYRNASQRQVYIRSRWVAAPAELLEQFLKRSLLGDASRGQCRLRLELDEFQQVFDTPEASRGVIEVRASLYGGAGRTQMARQNFHLSHPAASADARGGMAALGAAASDLSRQLRAWLEGDLSRQCQQAF